MSRMTSQPSSDTSKGLAARVFGVLTAPRTTYADVAARPRALGVMVVALVVSVTAVATFLSTEVGQRAALDQQLRTMESFGIKVTDAAYERLQHAGRRAPVFGAIGQTFSLLAGSLVVSGLMFGIFSAGLG